MHSRMMSCFTLYLLHSHKKTTTANYLCIAIRYDCVIDSYAYILHTLIVSAYNTYGCYDPLIVDLQIFPQCLLNKINVMFMIIEL